MATLRETIYSILQVDAQMDSVGHLGALLDKHTAAPYGVYYMHPPEVTESPFVTWYMNAAIGYMPKTVALNVTSWGDTFEQISQRLYDLFHMQEASFVSCSDFRVLKVRYDWSSPDRWDEDLKHYTRTDRFLIDCVRIFDSAT